MKLLRILLHYSRKSVILAILMGALAGLASSGLIALINTALSRSGSAARGRLILWGFVALVLFLPLARNLSAFFLNLAGQRAAFDLRMNLTRKILAAPLFQLERLGTHRLLAALTSDVNSMSGAFLQIPLIAINTAVILGCLAYMAWLSWLPCLLVIGLMALGLATYRIPVRSGLERQRRAREVADNLFSCYKAVTEGAKELKLHSRRRASFLGSLETWAEKFLKLNIIATTIYRVGGSWEQLLFFIAIGLLLFLGPTMGQIPSEVLTGYVLTILYMMSPLQLLLNAIPALSQANVAVEKVEKLGLSLVAEKATASKASEEAAASPAFAFGSRLDSIQLKGVVYNYDLDGLDGSAQPRGGLKLRGRIGLQPPDGGAPGPAQDGKKKRLRTFGFPGRMPLASPAGSRSGFTVGPIDLELKPGELFFLTGGNGSGKTTLAKLITGLYTPQLGEVRVNNQAVSNENREIYRQLFAAVFTDFFLFERLLGLEEVPDLDEQARSYLTQLQLTQKVKVENGSLSTLDLSQGQRKRLALMTAYLEDRPVYIFDEWAADQDPQFKDFFYETLLPQLKAKGKAVVVISHDDRYYHIADRILKLEDGRPAS